MVLAEVFLLVSLLWCQATQLCKISNSQYSNSITHLLLRFHKIISSLKVLQFKLESQSIVIIYSLIPWIILRTRIMLKDLWCLNSWKSKWRIKTNPNLKLRNLSLFPLKTKLNLQPDSYLLKTPQQRVLNPTFQPTPISSCPVTVMQSLLKCAMSLKLMLSNSTIKRVKLILIPSWEEVAGKCKARLDLHSRQLKLDSRLSTMEITSLILRRNLIACSSRCSPRRWVD